MAKYILLARFSPDPSSPLRQIWVEEKRPYESKKNAKKAAEEAKNTDYSTSLGLVKKPRRVLVAKIN